MTQDYEVSTTNVEPVCSGTYSDAGMVYEVTCPTCGQKIAVGEYGWWDTTCACGIQWVRVEVTAIGLKPDA